MCFLGAYFFLVWWSQSVMNKCLVFAASSVLCRSLPQTSKSTYFFAKSLRFCATSPSLASFVGHEQPYTWRSIVVQGDVCERRMNPAPFEHKTAPAEQMKAMLKHNAYFAVAASSQPAPFSKRSLVTLTCNGKGKGTSAKSGVRESGKCINLLYRLGDQ